jgi:diguanylate cyclase (GGDEF)-like protein
VSLLDPATGLFQYEAFLHLLLRETGRGTRYRDFFTLCLFKPDVAPENAEFEPAIDVALSTRVAEFIRSTDIVGRFPMGLGVLLLHTGHTEALGVAERVRAAVRRVEFRRGPDLPPIQLTLSAGVVSFPRDGQTSTTLLARAKRYLEQARQHGGDKVVHGS